MKPELSKSTFDAVRIKQDFPGLADERLHYLDNAATAQMPKVVFEALYRFEVDARANVHESVHSRARAATEAYGAARLCVAHFLGVNSEEEVVFTYGTTSAINLLAHSFGARLAPGDEIVLSVLEHHSNLVPWQQLAARRGVVLRFLPMTAEGRLDLDALQTTVGDRCRLVAVTHCSNVTGAVTDVARVVRVARAVGAKILLDGAQRAPHGPLDMHALDVDFYVFSGHKTFGPTGIGVLWGRRELLETMPPFMTGGQMIEQVTLDGTTFRAPPRRFEAGTPPIGPAVGLGAALEWMAGLNWEGVWSHEVRLTQRLIDGLAALPGVRVFGPLDVQGRRGVVSFTISSLSAGDTCRRLDEKGLALRGGHHCAQPLLRAFGVEGVARASLAPYNVDADVDALLEGVRELALRQLKAGAR